MAKKRKDFSSGDICYAYYVFDEDDEKGKQMPTAVLLQVSPSIAKKVGEKSTEGKYICYPITSQKPPAYMEENFYEILDWEQCGLKAASWIKCLPVKSRIFGDTELSHKGKLTDKDIEGFSKKVLETSSRSAKKEA